MLYRRFGFLQARLILNKQAELITLESDLERLDVARGESNAAKESNARGLRSQDIDRVINPTRTKLISDIEVKFKDYGN